MTERSDVDKIDELMLPGFRFHPTDEELVGFYLKRKIQQRPLSIELIKQLDIYKFDPWDLPKLAASGEKEWYFYCPRGQKYRNSTRPNRVTGAGFWKATGTDRPIYSSEGTRCIGLKKSLVFYRGKAAKGTKTNWMMHEFRLPSLTDSSMPQRLTDKKIPSNDAWAICRIFQKTNSMAQRALSHSWLSHLPETPDSCRFTVLNAMQGTQFNSENNSCTTTSPNQLANVLQQEQQPYNTNYPPLAVNSYKPMNATNCKPDAQPVPSAEIPAGFMFSPFDMSVPSRCINDVPSMLHLLSPSITGDDEKPSSRSRFSQQQQCTNLTVDLPLEIIGNFGSEEEEIRKSTNMDDSQVSNNQWGTLRTVTFPFNLTQNFPDEWKPNIAWDAPSISE